MSRLSIIFSMLWLAVATASPSNAATEPRAPTKPWVVEFAESTCLASREYGTGKDVLILSFKPSPIGNFLQLSIGISDRRETVHEQKAMVQINDRAPIEAKLLAFRAKDKKTRVLRIILPDEKLQPLSEAKTLSVHSLSEIDETFSLTAMAPLSKQMAACIDDLRSQWNMSDDAKGKFKTRAKANLASFVKDADYPQMALDRGETGETRFALLVDETGKVADCTVVETSGIPTLDAQTCGVIMERARFSPAIDADGRPTRDSLTSRIRWVMDPPEKTEKTGSRIKQ